MKKTYSFDFRGASHHIISYFNPEDVRSGELKRPIHCEIFQKTFIRPELIEQGARSRNPITEAQIEQQRWERPLYQNDSSVSLMGQYPLPQNVSFPNAGQIIDYPSSHKHAISQPHALMHRSSIHFPMEENVYHSTTAPTGYPQPLAPNAMHARHASMSGSVSEGFQRPQLREHIARAVATIDTTVESNYQTPTSAVPHPQSQRSLNQSPIDVKSGSVFEGEEGGEPAYVHISQAPCASPETLPPGYIVLSFCCSTNAFSLPAHNLPHPRHIGLLRLILDFGPTTSEERQNRDFISESALQQFNLGAITIRSSHGS